MEANKTNAHASGTSSLENADRSPKEIHYDGSGASENDDSKTVMDVDSPYGVDEEEEEDDDHDDSDCDRDRDDEDEDEGEGEGEGEDEDEDGDDEDDGDGDGEEDHLKGVDNGDREVVDGQEDDAEDPGKAEGGMAPSGSSILPSETKKQDGDNQVGDWKVLHDGKTTTHDFFHYATKAGVKRGRNDDLRLVFFEHVWPTQSPKASETEVHAWKKEVLAGHILATVSLSASHTSISSDLKCE